MTAVATTPACIAAELLPPEFPPLGLMPDLDQDRERLVAAFTQAHDERVDRARQAVEQGEADDPEDPQRVSNVMTREQLVVAARNAEADALDALVAFATRAALAETKAARTELARLCKAGATPERGAGRIAGLLVSAVHIYLSSAFFPPIHPQQRAQDNPDFSRERLHEAYSQARAMREACEGAVEAAEAVRTARAKVDSTPEGLRAAAVAEVLGHAPPADALASERRRLSAALTTEAEALSDVLAFAERVVAAELAGLRSQAGAIRGAAERSWVNNIR